MDRRHRLLKHAPAIAGTLLVVLIVSGLVWLIRGVVNTKQEPRQSVEVVTLIRPPPPPPPLEKPPPPPPPEKVDQPLPKDTPEPTPHDNQPAPTPQLGLDASGSAGSDAFGLAARPGGAALVGTGGAVFSWYTSRLASDVNDRLSNDAKLRGKPYSGSVYVWVGTDGSIKNVRLADSTGDHGIDSTILTDVSSMGHIGDAPPIEMPEPVRLQIVSRT